MRKIYLLIFSLILIHSVLALNLNVEKKSSDEVMIAGLNEPVEFELEITNLGESDNFEFYNLLGFQISDFFRSQTKPVFEGFGTVLTQHRRSA